jgi:hypothetical protein
LASLGHASTRHAAFLGVAQARIDSATPRSLA